MKTSAASCLQVQAMESEKSPIPDGMSPKIRAVTQRPCSRTAYAACFDADDLISIAMGFNHKGADLSNFSDLISSLRSNISDLQFDMNTMV